MSDDEVELARITIRKTLDDDGAGIEIDTSDDLGITEAAGMLAFAQHTILTTHGTDEM